MSGFTEHRTPDASDQPGGDVMFTWGAAQGMLPLVSRIVADLVRLEGHLSGLRPERERLDRKRHSLVWPERARRYQLGEAIAAAERELADVRGELEALTVEVLHPASGLVGFATVVNGRRAYFSWRPGEEGIGFWNFAGDPARRPVPAAWTQPPPKRPGKGKSRSAK
jgi:hypothetical protein